MNRIVSYFYSKNVAIWRYLLINYSEDQDELRKIRLMYGISLIGIFFLLLLGTIAFAQGGMLLGMLDYLTALILVVLLVFLWKKICQYRCIFIGIAVMFFLYLYLFISGGIAGNAFLWSYTFPLFSFFLLGPKKGFLASLLYFFSCSAILLTDIFTSFVNLYDINLAIRFIPSFATVILFSLVYETFRENSQKALMAVNTTLEQQVAERTVELHRQIKEKDRAKAQAIRAKEEWERTFDAVPDLISIHDRELRMIRANKAVTQLLDIPPRQLRKKSCYEWFHGMDTPPSFCPLLKLIADQQVHTAEFFDEARQRYVAVTVSPLQGEQGELLGVVHVARDITVQKQAEEELKQYAETQAVLLREVNHRVKNNLISIISMLYQEKDRETGKLQTDTTACLQDVITRIEGLLTVHSLLSTSQWSPLALSMLCREIIQGTTSSMSRTRPVDLQVSSSDVLVDSDQAHYLTLVLNELATNSMKYAVGDQQRVQIAVDIDRKDGIVCLAYQDDGPGYPDSILTGTFPKGKIGLHLIQGIVNQSLQGNMELQNTPGGRARIFFPEMISETLEGGKQS